MIEDIGMRDGTVINLYHYDIANIPSFAKTCSSTICNNNTTRVNTKDHANDICSMYQYITETAIYDATNPKNPPSNLNGKIAAIVPRNTAIAQCFISLFRAPNILAPSYTGIVVDTMITKVAIHQELVEKLISINMPIFVLIPNGHS